MDSIIVYRNPVEKALWEGELNWLVLGLLVAIVVLAVFDEATEGRYPRLAVAAGIIAGGGVSWMMF